METEPSIPQDPKKMTREEAKQFIDSVMESLKKNGAYDIASVVDSSNIEGTPLSWVAFKTDVYDVDWSGPLVSHRIRYYFGDKVIPARGEISMLPTARIGRYIHWSLHNKKDVFSEMSWDEFGKFELDQFKKDQENNSRRKFSDEF